MTNPGDGDAGSGPGRTRGQTHKPSVYLKLEQKICSDESGSLEHRYEFGAELLKARAGRERLPKGYLADRIAEARAAGITTVSERDYQRRMKLAEVYPTKAHRRQALTLMGSWTTIVEKSFPAVDVDESPSPEDLLDAIEDAARAEREEFEQPGLFPDTVKNVPLVHSTLRYLVAYADEMESMTASYHRRDVARREHLGALILATGGDLDVFYPEAVAVLRKSLAHST